MKGLLTLVGSLMLAETALADAEELADPEAAGEAKEGRHELGLFAEMVGGLRATFADQADFNAFVLDAAELGLDYAWEEGVVLSARAEAVRAVTPESPSGIDGDSILVRFYQAYGGYDHALGPGHLTARLGLVPDVWIDTVEGRYALAGTRATMAERGAFFEVADLGLSLGYALWEGALELRWQLSNGEGPTQTEQNTAKNTTVVLSGRLLNVAMMGAGATFGLHASYRDGALGAASVRDSRVSGALTMAHRRLGAGVELSYAMGHRGRSELTALGVGAWAWGTPIDGWLGIYATFDQLVTDTDLDDSGVRLIKAGVFTDFGSLDEHGAHRVRLYLSLENQSFGDNSGPAPGVGASANNTQVMLHLEATGLATLAL